MKNVVRRKGRGGVLSPARRVRSRPRGPILFTATQAKNEFGSVLEQAMQGGVVMITKHHAPKAVLMSMDEFNALSRATEVRLGELSGEFDALLARMQTSRARSAMKTAFGASPRQLGRAALAAARKRG